MYLRPGHSYIAVDRGLCNKSMDLFDEILTTTHDKAFIALRKLADELSSMADTALEKHRSRQDDSFEDMIFRHDFDDSLFGLQDWNFDTAVPDFSVENEAQREFE